MVHPNLFLSTTGQYISCFPQTDSKQTVQEQRRLVQEAALRAARASLDLQLREMVANIQQKEELISQLRKNEATAQLLSQQYLVFCVPYLPLHDCNCAINAEAFCIADRQGVYISSFYFDIMYRLKNDRCFLHCC